MPLRQMLSGRDRQDPARDALLCLCVVVEGGSSVAVTERRRRDLVPILVERGVGPVTDGFGKALAAPILPVCGDDGEASWP